MIWVALMENNKKDVTDMAESKYHFERLTPIVDMDLEVYEDAINYVFDNQDIKNVAITGAYSAGKSSVLASYKKNMRNYAFCIFPSHTSSLQIKKMKQKRIKKEQMNLH